MSEELDLPVAAVNRMVKDALPEGCSVAKDAKTALVKAATQFIIHATQYSNEVTMKKKKKTMTGEHVLEALKDIEFDDYYDVLHKSLEMFQEQQDGKKKERSAKKATADGGEDDADADGGEGEGEAEAEAEVEVEVDAEGDGEAEPEDDDKDAMEEDNEEE